MANLTYFKKFSTKSDYDTYIGGDPVLPNVSIVANEDVYFKDGEGPVPPHDYSQDYLTFVMLEDDATVSTSYDDIFFSSDNGETWLNGEITGLSAGDKVLIKANRPAFVGSNKTAFSVDKNFNVEGNIMSLTYGDNFKNQTTLPPYDEQHEYGEFCGIFFYCSSLISAENLVLPATTLTEKCYSDMFIECTSLTTAPELPAATLAENCYNNMFQRCISLNYIKCLATNISADNCTYNWVNGVAATGTFVKDASMTDWTSGSDGIPNGWTVQDA